MCSSWNEAVSAWMPPVHGCRLRHTRGKLTSIECPQQKKLTHLAPPASFLPILAKFGHAGLVSRASATTNIIRNWVFCETGRERLDSPPSPVSKEAAAGEEPAVTMNVHEDRGLNETRHWSLTGHGAAKVDCSSPECFKWQPKMIWSLISRIA